MASIPTERKELTSTAWAAQLAGYIAAAQLTDDQKLVVALHFEGASLYALLDALGYTDDAPGRKRLRCLIGQAAAKLSAHIPDFWAPARDFPRQLLACVANRRVEDEPEFPSLHEGTPQVRDRLPAATMMSAGDYRLRQDGQSALRLLHQARGAA